MTTLLYRQNAFVFKGQSYLISNSVRGHIFNLQYDGYEKTEN
ncbi:MAG: hypothetical protein ETSY2_07345 [Candidatus Entotheonella gemina]|uniref:Uncharacterized protein n=1 Tax=Candidatus Entotheonella gemina TaxID=1429439 RepID=W4MD17_9BACT|nr:MAG: hypothetical protein ETSY2_07345 [Candidatus Entotheonella gemina]